MHFNLEFKTEAASGGVIVWGVFFWHTCLISTEQDSVVIYFMVHCIQKNISQLDSHWAGGNKPTAPTCALLLSGNEAFGRLQYQLSIDLNTTAFLRTVTDCVDIFWSLTLCAHLLTTPAS